MATRRTRPARQAKAPTVAAELTQIHLPPPSYWPILLAFGVVLIAIGIIFTLFVSAIGVIVMLASIVGWTQENRDNALKETGHE